MRVALLADIHGNLEALLAVLDAVSRAEADVVLCLGDVVGYGAEPRECIEELRSRNICGVAGNHDFAVSGKCDLDYFNAEARESVLWTRSRLSGEDLEFLGGLPLVYEGPMFSAAHGSFAAPEAFDYVLTPLDARVSFGSLGRPWGFFGHSHIPVSFVLNGDEIRASEEDLISLPPGAAALVNVGSVGQPRDFDARACFALFDGEKGTVELVRVEYEVEKAAGKIVGAGLPARNAYRLYLGR